jgi:hypothetical protein
MRIDVDGYFHPIKDDVNQIILKLRNLSTKSETIKSTIYVFILTRNKMSRARPIIDPIGLTRESDIDELYEKYSQKIPDINLIEKPLEPLFLAMKESMLPSVARAETLIKPLMADSDHELSSIATFCNIVSVILDEPQEAVCAIYNRDSGMGANGLDIFGFWKIS